MLYFRLFSVRVHAPDIPSSYCSHLFLEGAGAGLKFPLANILLARESIEEPFVFRLGAEEWCRGSDKEGVFALGGSSEGAAADKG